MNIEQHRRAVKMRNIPGDAHFLTYSCYRNRPFLKGPRACSWFCESLSKSCVDHDVALWGYVIMPEHLLVKPRRLEYSIGSFHKSVKSSVALKAYSYRQRSNKPDSVWEPFYDVAPDGCGHFRFWQRGSGYDHNVASLSGLPEILNYIHQNPVRRGLCTQASDWPWSSAADYCEHSTGPVAIERLQIF